VGPSWQHPGLGILPRSGRSAPDTKTPFAAESSTTPSGQICCELSAARDRRQFVTQSVLTPLLDGQPRDPWRGFKLSARRAVMTRAGGQCEAPMLLAWGRCHDSTTEVDHVYPWSRGGPTVVSNGQALCRAHNRRKSNLRPPWWYVLSLERRRTAYSPPDVTVRVLGRMSADERATAAMRNDRRKC
jgi:hypothetical protein